MGEIQPLKGRHLRFLTGVVLGTEAMPDDTLGCWVAPALRHLMLVDGCSADDALTIMESYLHRIPDVRFSDRLNAGDVAEVMRTARYLARKIAEGNLYQDRPEESSAIFEKVGAYCRRLGFVFADPATWHVLDRRPGAFDKSAFDISACDFCLTFEEKLAVKQPVCALLKCDVQTAYQAAHAVKAFAIKYPGKELPGNLVPQLCAGLPIRWSIPSDEGARCKLGERFLRLLCALGIVKLLKEKHWHGPGHSQNRAAVYGLPKDVAAPESDIGREWYYGSWTRHQRGQQGTEPETHKKTCIYNYGHPHFTEEDLEVMAAELERLNRAWSPRYHSSG
jgi:hypothetical protein